MSASLQIRKQLDRMACGRQLAMAIWASGTKYWPLVDAAADEVYENRVKGQKMTDLDNALDAGDLLDATFRDWFNLHSTYFETDLLLSGWDQYLAQVGFRMPCEAAETLAGGLGDNQWPLPRNVAAKGTLPVDESNPAASGMHLFGTLTGASTYAEVDGALDITKIVGAPIVAISREATQGASSLIMDPVLQDGTTKIAAGVAIAPSDTQYGQVILGKQAITGVAGPVFSCAATGQFVEGEWVLLYEGADGDSSKREVAQIKTIVANTSVEFEAAPVLTFTASGFIIPMYTNVSRKSGTITGGKHLDFYALPDRIVAL